MHCNPVLLDEILRSSSNRNVLKSLTKLFNSAKIITNKSRGRSSLSPESVKEAMDCRFSQFRGHEQQDAHEFLQCILNSLHIDFRSGEREKTSIIEEDNGFVVSPLQFWISHTTSNRSVVQDQFEGLTTSLTTCPDCSFTRRTFILFTVCVCVCISVTVFFRTNTHTQVRTNRS
jgi:ubiquitin C-terminal hydrolase